MSIEAALTQQLLSKPTGAAKVPLVAGTAIGVGDKLTITNEGKAITTSYNRVPDNVISESFTDYMNANQSTSSSMIMNGRIVSLGSGYYMGVYQQYDTAANRFDIIAYTWKVDTANQVASVISEVNVTSDYNTYSGTSSYNQWFCMVTPEQDYALVSVAARDSSSFYQNRWYRLTMNPTTKALSAKTSIHSVNQSSTYVFAEPVGATGVGGIGGYHTTGTGTALGDRRFLFNRYYSTSFDSIASITLDGSVSYVTSNTGMPQSWYEVGSYSQGYAGNTLLYYPNGSYINTMDTTLGVTNNTSYYDRIQVQTASDGSDGVYFTTGNMFFQSPVADANGKVYWVMWAGGREITTYRFNVGNGKASFDGKYTHTITDNNMFIPMRFNYSNTTYGHRWTQDGNDFYSTMVLYNLPSTTTDTPTDYQAGLIKLNWDSTNGGFYYPTFQGFLDLRLGSSTANPLTIIDENGVTVYAEAVDWSTTDGVNDYKHGVFKVSGTGVASPEYAHGVKAIALEAATTGQTLNALSYAPVFYDASLTAGENYGTHIVSSTKYLLEKS